MFRAGSALGIAPFRAFPSRGAVHLSVPNAFLSLLLQFFCCDTWKHCHLSSLANLPLGWFPGPNLQRASSIGPWLVDRRQNRSPSATHTRHSPKGAHRTFATAGSTRNTLLEKIRTMPRGESRKVNHLCEVLTHQKPIGARTTFARKRWWLERHDHVYSTGPRKDLPGKHNPSTLLDRHPKMLDHESTCGLSCCS